jgi:hypothetical protein
VISNTQNKCFKGKKERDSEKAGAGNAGQFGSYGNWWSSNHNQNPFL